MDLVALKNTQLNNEQLLSIVQKHIDENNNDSIYTYKDIEDIELICKANYILVPKVKQQDLLDWYHKILVYPGEHRMIESTKLLFTWSSTEKQVKRNTVYYHQKRQRLLDKKD